jgi:hypothetical protein
MEQKGHTHNLYTKIPLKKYQQQYFFSHSAANLPFPVHNLCQIFAPVTIDQKSRHVQ